MDTSVDHVDSSSGRLMMSTPAHTAENEALGQRRRRWPWIIGGVIAMPVVLLRIASGFYFAGLIRSDGLPPGGPQAFIDAAAGPIEDDTITLIPVGDPTDATFEDVDGLT